MRLIYHIILLMSRKNYFAFEGGGDSERDMSDRGYKSKTVRKEIGGKRTWEDGAITDP
jgi:hypothetical protein